MNKKIHLVTLFIALFVSGKSQLAPCPTLATSNVSEASQYGVMYRIELPANGNFQSSSSFTYAVNAATVNTNYTRVAYFMQLDNKWVWVSMNKFNSTNAELGMPYNGSGIAWQQTVSALNVTASANSGITNTANVLGTIEIYPHCYGTALGITGAGGNGNIYDYNDTYSPNSNCHGAFQVHNANNGQTMFGYNSYMNTAIDDLGIGSNTLNAHPDWTFMQNASTYTTRTLWILVNNIATFPTQPSSVTVNACKNGTLAPYTVSVSAPSNTITSYTWYINNTASANGGTAIGSTTTSATSNSVAIPTGTAGTFYVYCEVNTINGTSKSAISGAINIDDPTITATSGASSICAGASITLSTTTILGAANAPINSYTWSSGSNASTTTVSPTITTTYSVIGSNTLGCISNTSTLSIVVNTVPIISITGTNAICNGSNAILTGAGASSYTWNTGITTTTISVAPTVNTTYTLSGKNAANCQSSNTIAVTIYSLPLLSITGSNTLCSGGSIMLTGSGASTYVWSNASTTSSISVAPTINTTYTLSGVSAQGCSAAAAATLAVTVYSLPVLSIGSTTTTICPSQSVTLSGSGASTYTWIGLQNAQNITVSPTVTSTYTLTGSSTQGCLGNSPTLAITVNTVPVITITGTNGVCSGSTIVLTANGASTYTWTNPSASTNTVSVTPTANTTYTVNGMSSAGCIGTNTILSVTVYSLPTISISASSSNICNGQTLTLTANGANTYTWSTTSSVNSITVNPTANTTYTLRGTSAQGCISSSAASLAVTVNSVPVIAISSATSAICNGQSVTLNANGASTYTWNTNSNSTALAVSPATTTTYSLSGTSAQGCVGNIAVSTITVFNLPLLAITGTSSLCVGQSVVLTANGASTYTWSNSTNAASIAVTPTASAVYSLTGTSTTGCIGTVTTLAVTVFTLPTISISGNTFICNGVTATLTASGASSYTWTGNTNGTTKTITPTTNTTYTATGTNTNGCVNSSAVTVTVNAIPVISLTGNGPICAGETATVSASGASSFTWHTGTSGAQVALTPTVASGQYTFSLNGTSTAGCVGSKVDSLLVNALPSVTISGNAFICTGGSTTLTASGANTYTWENGATTFSVVLTPSASLQFSITGTSTAGCNGSISTSISVVSLPTVIVTGNTVVCSGESVTLTANGANTYSWSSGATGSVVVITPSSNTTYTTVGEISQGCTDSTTTGVTVNPLPVLVLTPSVATICEGETLTVNATGASTYSWSNGVTTSSVAMSPTTTTTYTLNGTSQENCSSITTLSVAVDPCTAIDIRLIATVAIYPNPGSGVYLVSATSEIVNVEVYNSVGQKVTTTTSIINIGELANGIYTVSINLANGQSFHRQIIKN
jgi:hypothetical protein